MRLARTLIAGIVGSALIAGCAGASGPTSNSPSNAPEAVPATAIASLEAPTTQTTRQAGGTLTIGAAMTVLGNLTTCQTFPNTPAGDVAVGDQVQLVDENGTVIAIARLVGSETTVAPEGEPFCYLHMTYIFDEVPDAKFYQVKIGSHEGPIESFDELSGRKWIFNPVVLGSFS
jgi:hypothetical protein